MKTGQPVILTARVAEKDIEPFDRLRQAHFPPDRNFLNAHLTMFHRLPGEYFDRIVEQLKRAADGYGVVAAEVSGLRHLGAGVAYSINSSSLQDIRVKLKFEFNIWLAAQDLQKWHPHITIQNKAPKAAADALYRNLSQSFHAHPIEIMGLDLWEYLGGPWRQLNFVPFKGTEQTCGII